MKKILLLEDNPTDADLVSWEIKNRWPDIELKVVSRLAEARKLMQGETIFDIAIFDLKLPDGNGMDLLSELRANKCDLPIIILTGTGSEEIAIVALKAGANDYISKKPGFHKQIPGQIEFTLIQALENQKHLSVLYVEHQQSDIDLTIHYFKKYAPHIHLKLVSTGEEALNLLPENSESICNFDVLLLDYRLPGLNAIEITKLIRLERKLSIAIIIVTGQGDENIAVEALKIGADDYIIKHENYLLRLPSVLTSAFRRKELERQKRELKQSETKFRLLADYAADWEYWINPKGEYIYISPACEQTSGYHPEAFQKNKELLFEITRADYREAIAEHFKQKIKELHKPIEFPIKTVDGKEKWISHFCRPVYDEDNTYLGKRGVNRDITGRRKAEKELQESEEKFRVLYNNSPDMYVSVSPDDAGILLCNDTLLNKTGYARKEIIGSHVFKMYHDDCMDEVKKAFQQFVETGIIQDKELILKRKDGSKIDVSLNVNAVKDEAGKILYSISSWRDITDRKQVEQELRESEEFVKRLIASSNDCIKVLDLEGNLLLMSAGGQKLLEIDDITLYLNKYWVDFWKGKDRDAAIKAISIARKGDVGKFSGFCETEKGTPKWWEIIITPINDAQGNLESLLAISRDITDRKKVNEALRESEERAHRQRAAITKLAIDKNLSGGNLSEGFRKLTKIVSATLGVERVSIWILSEDETELRCISMYEAGKKKHSDGLSLLTESFPSYFEALRKESRIYAHDAQTDPRTLELRDNYLVPLGITSMLDAGIQIAGKFAGVICLEHIGDKRKWGVDEEAFASTVASVVSQGFINSKRKQAEKKLKDSEEKHRTYIENAPEGLFIVDSSGKYIDVNPAACQMTGYSREEFLDMSIKDLASPESPPEALETFNKLKEKGKIQSEILLRRKNDTDFYASLSAVVLSDDRLMAFCSDITERKRAEQIQKVLYNISNAIITTDNLEQLIGLIQEELGIVIDTTNFYVALYNSKTDTISLPFFADEKDNLTSFPAGKSLTKYVITTQKPLLANKEKLKTLGQKGVIKSFGSDAEIWLGVPLKVEGKITGVLVIQSYTDENAFNESDLKMLEFVSDQISISIDRKKSEEDLIVALIKAEESDRLKIAFLHNVSHEIRTPMSGILGFTDLLLEPELTGKEQQTYIDIIKKSGDRMLNTVNDLMDISRIESGVVKLAVSEVNVNDQTKDIYAFFKPEAEKKGIQLFFKNTLAEQEAIIKIDRVKIYAILTNLIKNAIKYSDEGTIEFGYNLKADSEPAELEFFVKDTGIGIPNDRQQAIFDRFVQADIEDTRAFEGSGLGLSISKAYVEMLGGRIWVESEEDVGSQFYFTIPYNPKPEEKTTAINETPKKKIEDQITDLKILIAEDVEEAVMYLKLVVKKFSSEILYAETGTETVEICRNNPDIDLILMDIKMPKMNGYEATRQIREFNKDVVIIAQTAYALYGDREKALEAGCNDYISKPINKGELMKKIGRFYRES